MVEILGTIIDDQGRCIHYDSFVDVIGNKCYLCKKYYACFQCHDECETHQFVPWPVSKEPNARVVICGICYFEMTANDYGKQDRCLNCEQLFNPNCSRHKQIYFC